MLDIQTPNRNDNYGLGASCCPLLFLFQQVQMQYNSFFTFAVTFKNETTGRSHIGTICP